MSDCDQDQGDVRYGDDTHRLFNEWLEIRRNRQVGSSSPNGPWLSVQAQAALPDMNQDFDMMRDPFIRAQLRDRYPLSAKERDDQQGRGSAMVRKDRLGQELRPPEAVRRAIDRNSFMDRWLAEQRDAAFAQANDPMPINEIPAPSRTVKEPSR